MTRSGIKVYRVLLPGAKKIPADNTDETKLKETSSLKLLSFTAYNQMVRTQEDTVYFHIVEEVKTKSNKYGDGTLVWKNFQEHLSQPQGLLRQYYARNSLSAN